MHCETLVWLKSVIYQPQLLSVWYLLKHSDTMKDFQTLKGSAEGNEVCVFLCVILNQLDLPTPLNSPQKQ